MVLLVIQFCVDVNFQCFENTSFAFLRSDVSLIQGYAARGIAATSLEEKLLIFSVCLFLWCKYSLTMYVSYYRVEKRYAVAHNCQVFPPC